MNSKNISLRLRSGEFLRTRPFRNSRSLRQKKKIFGRRKHMFSFVDWWKQRESRGKSPELFGKKLISRARGEKKTARENIFTVVDAINNFPSHLLSLNVRFIIIFMCEIYLRRARISPIVVGDRDSKLFPLVHVRVFLESVRHLGNCRLREHTMKLIFSHTGLGWRRSCTFHK